MTTYNPATLPRNDNLNRFAFVVDVSDQIFIRKGKMIAFYGNLSFEAMGSSVVEMLARRAFNAPKYIHNFVVAQGQGQLILGDNGNDLACYDLDAANMTIRAKNLLGFSKNVICQESTLPGYLTLLGTGKVIASSNGPVHFLELPCRVDEQAVLGWADCPSPSYRYDYAHVTGFVSTVGALSGLTLSGEEKQVDFTGAGTVLVQSSELELSGNSALEHLLAHLPMLGKEDLSKLSLSVQQQSQQRR
ncbi:AIM24 family protein [Massilia genomosp. 1]|uniref:AIM24 family protein n=1 Tax=Massilia genomosp. 1 TaxID=2609280 RepID=A0ABX0MVP9_9BURK|nr:AIM24 family protein [Massilia genomosp. 1]NHZ64750.1 AIM24 family protein [Massilia genomosp. 1]